MKFLVLLLVISLSPVSFAQTLATDHFYIGGGISRNDVGNGFDEATGFQIFIGYEFDESVVAAPFRLAAEVGYLDSGDFDIEIAGVERDRGSAKGLWGNAVGTYNINDNVALLARAGIDIGDDDGLMAGIGGQFEFNDAIGIRVEYVIRDEIDSLQLNGVYYFE